MEESFREHNDRATRPCAESRACFGLSDYHPGSAWHPDAAVSGADRARADASGGRDHCTGARDRACAEPDRAPGCPAGRGRRRAGAMIEVTHQRDVAILTMVHGKANALSTV